ncbi:MAG: hypothetical protein Q9227_006765 [Pyrenula ochraceoflavens]
MVPRVGQSPPSLPYWTQIGLARDLLPPEGQRSYVLCVHLKTGLVPSASGSAYLELPPSTPTPRTFLPDNTSLKLSCVVHGPKPLQRNASYSPNLQLAALVKFAPFATKSRRGYIRDASERELGVHLETALKGVIIADRWPKSSIDVSVTILEGEEDRWWGDMNNEGSHLDNCGLMNTLSACITVASAALADAGIDCLDLLTGGSAFSTGDGKIWLDASPSEHKGISSACSVAYMSSRDEITEIWLKGDLSLDSTKSSNVQELMDSAIMSARAANTILQAAVKESAERKAARLPANANHTK